MPIDPSTKPDSVTMQSITSPQAGTTAPDFTAQTTAGKTVHLSDFRGKKLVLYFYPKDDTPGCTVEDELDRKSTRLNSSHSQISYAVFCLKKKTKTKTVHCDAPPNTGIL